MCSLSQPTLFRKSLFRSKRGRLPMCGETTYVVAYLVYYVNCPVACDDCVILYHSLGIGDSACFVSGDSVCFAIYSGLHSDQLF